MVRIGCFLQLRRAGHQREHAQIRRSAGSDQSRGPAFLPAGGSHALTPVGLRAQHTAISPLHPLHLFTLWPGRIHRLALDAISDFRAPGGLIPVQISPGSPEPVASLCKSRHRASRPLELRRDNPPSRRVELANCASRSGSSRGLQSEPASTRSALTGVRVSPAREPTEDTESAVQDESYTVISGELRVFRGSLRPCTSATCGRRIHCVETCHCRRETCHCRRGHVHEDIASRANSTARTPIRS